MTRNEMMNSMIQNFGFENPNTIAFFQFCEDFPELTDEELTATYNVCAIRATLETEVE